MTVLVSFMNDSLHMECAVVVVELHEPLLCIVCFGCC